MNQNASFAAQMRQEALLARIREVGRVSTADLLREAKASPATIRRDLAALVARGKLAKMRGGVILLPPGGESPHAARKAQAAEAKRAISAAADRLVPERASVFLDSGTTCLAIASALCRRASLTLYTNSLAIAELAPYAACSMIIVGGECRPVSLALVGAITLAQMDALRPDFAFVGATAVHRREGLFTTETSEAGVKAAILRAAKVRILAADSSKAGRTAAVRFARFSEIDLWLSEKFSARQMGQWVRQLAKSQAREGLRILPAR